MGFWGDKKRLSRALDRAGVRYALRAEGMQIVIDLHPEPGNLERARYAFTRTVWPAIDAWLVASPRPDRVVTETVTMTTLLGPATDAERAEEAALLAAMSAAPDDDAARLVYADRLMARGDPLGEFIVMQCQRDPALADRIAARLRHGWLGFAAEAAPFATHRERGRGYRFVRGFLDRVYMTVDDFVTHGARVFAYPPPTLEVTDWLPDCARLAAVPSLALVRRMVMRPGWHVSLGPLAGGAFDKLEHFELYLMNSTRHDRSQDDRTFFGSIRAPSLASIDVSHTNSTSVVRAIAMNPNLPRLRAYKEQAGFPSGEEDLATAYAILARRTALEALTLVQSAPGIGDGGVLPFFASDTACALRELALSKTGITDRFLHQVVRSPKVRLLERVRFGESALTLEGLRVFADAATSLRELTVSSEDPDVQALVDAVRSRQTSGG